MLFLIALSLLAQCDAVDVRSSELLADAVHAITARCVSRNEYEVCNDHATSELASCSPGDLNCQRTNVEKIQIFCRQVCGENDYVPYAVTKFLDEAQSQPQPQPQLQPQPPPHEQPQSPPGAQLPPHSQTQFDVPHTADESNKAIPATEATEALMLKQLTESRNHPPGSWKMVEDRFAPALSSFRGALQHPSTESPEKDNGKHLVPRSLHWIEQEILNEQTGQHLEQEHVGVDLTSRDHNNGTAREGAREEAREGERYQENKHGAHNANPTVATDIVYLYQPEATLQSSHSQATHGLLWVKEDSGISGSIKSLLKIHAADENSEVKTTQTEAVSELFTTSTRRSAWTAATGTATLPTSPAETTSEHASSERGTLNVFSALGNPSNVPIAPSATFSASPSFGNASSATSYNMTNSALRPKLSAAALIFLPSLMVISLLW